MCSCADAHIAQCEHGQRRLKMSEIKKIAITTDTNSGMFPHEHDDIGLFVLPMPFIIDGADYLESVTLSRADFYEKLTSNADIKTSQPSPADVESFWRDILKEYDEIVHIPTSSLLSNSFSTAKSLAEGEEFAGKVFMVDNKRISIALKSSAFDAVALRDQGMSAAEIAQTIEAMSADYSIYFSPDTMKYLQKGGRVSKFTATIGSILKVCPILTLQGGPIEKYQVLNPRLAPNAIKKAIKNDLNGKFKEYYEKGEMRLAVIFGKSPEDSQAFLEDIKASFPDLEVVYFDPISLSVACHTGPKVSAAACIRVVK